MNKLELVLKEETHSIYDTATMEALFACIDRLHDYAAAGRLHEVTTLSTEELQGWLEDLIYTARETLHEMGTTRRGQ
ncbi:MAG: hypothetical protein HC876_00065 [Chloroflexaceae bacterium]|nr:hypothetical protein [Chloroflexaceae bacterium]NJO04078.1 hypothetical protein [Chloroflexaceae bacterium]